MYNINLCSYLSNNSSHGSHFQFHIIPSVSFSLLFISVTFFLRVFATCAFYIIIYFHYLALLIVVDERMNE